MSNPIAARWETLRAEGRAALIPYVTAGFPSPSESLATLRMLETSGADFVEVGIPFSDPVADGPVIQASTEQALKSGMTVERALGLVRDAALEVPVIAFGYLNPILAYGVDRFLHDAADAGISGLLVTDLPAGEDPYVEAKVHESPLDLIRLVAPTTDPHRIATIAERAEGFIYLISRLGVTGPATALDDTVTNAVATVRRATALPIAVGFGIRTKEQAAHAARVADGVVVGTALIRAIAESPEAARHLMQDLRDAVRSPNRLLDGAETVGQS